jgi:small GTP-binding protein
MPTIDDVLQEFPDSSRDQLRRAWDALPASMQRELRNSLGSLPNNLGLWRMLLNQAITQYRIAFGEKRRVAIVGPANVGKSTLYNQLIRSRRDRAEVSAVPGTTRVNQEADAGLFAVVDTPGADAVGEVGEVEKARALEAAQAADFLIIVFDAIQGVKRAEQELFHELAGLGKPYIVVLNKIDLVRRDAPKVIERVAANLGLGVEQVVPIVARDGSHMDRVLLAVAKAEPQMVAALGQALPEFRWKLAWNSITGAASTAAVIALTPLPILDVVPLLAVQSSLVLGIARIYNYRITPARARELAVTFGLGFLGRTLFQEMSKLGGPPGWLLAAGIASATTVVMGYAAVVWFERGERLSGDTLRRITRGVTDYLLASLRGLGRRRPDRKSLKQSVEAALQEARLGDELSMPDSGLKTQGSSAEQQEGEP